MLLLLEGILDDLLLQPGSTLPSETRILGVAPSGSGGVADLPGSAAFGDIRALERLCCAGISARKRIASPEMFPEAEMLRHPAAEPVRR